jgi:hypothetical protein
LFSCKTHKKDIKETAFVLKGQMLYHDWNTDVITIDSNGYTKKFKLPVVQLKTDFSSPVLYKNKDAFLMQMSEKISRDCYNYSIVSFNTSGELIDTILTAKNCNTIDFMLSPNDSLLLVRIFKYPASEGTCTYKIYDTKNLNVIDSLVFDSVRIPFLEGFNQNIWSPNSKQVLLFDNKEEFTPPIIYNLITKERTRLPQGGNNFIWAPNDANSIAYLNNNKIYFYNTASKKSTEFFRPKRKQTITNFRYTLIGEAIIVNIVAYWLNIESYITYSPKHIIISTYNKSDFEEYNNMRVIDSWK